MATLILVSNVTATITPLITPEASSTEPAPIVIAEPTVPELIEMTAEKYEVNGELAKDIAACESHLKQYNNDGSVIRGRDNPLDVGVFQINEDWHLADSRKLGLNIYTTRGNIEYAMHLLKKEGARHWKYSKPCWGNKA